jgi:hypothetical protein
MENRNMRSIVFLASIGCLLASAPSVIAQEQVSTTAQDEDWSHVLKLKPGTQITVTVRDSEPRRRSVVRGDDSRLIALNLEALAAPSSTVRILSSIVSKHPEAFAPRDHAGTFLERDVRVGPDGVFQGDRKIAELQDVAETIARDDIVEITARRKGGGILGHLGPLGGYFIGGLTGGYVGALLCRCDAGFGRGMLAGGIYGGVLGYRSAVRDREQLIYRAPY